MRVQPCPLVLKGLIERNGRPRARGPTEGRTTAQPACAVRHRPWERRSRYDAPVPDDEMLEGFAHFLGMSTVEANGDRVVLACDMRPDHHQPYGIVHGGVHCALVETAASVGAALWLGEDGHVVGVSNQTDFLRAARGGRLLATAVPVHRGRLQQLWSVDVTAEDGRSVARGQVRLQNLPPDHFSR